MKLVRIVRTGRLAPEPIMRLVSEKQLNYCQLDYVSPDAGENFLLTAAVCRTSVQESFLRDLAAVHTQLFLNPELKIVTNSGSAGVVDCLEATASYLCEHGSSEMLLCGVRGASLLGELDVCLPAEQLPSRAEVVSAQARMGAGPIAAALVEGAQIVVCSEYDVSAPFIAAAVGAGRFSWHDYSALAALAAAAQLPGAVVHLDETGHLDLELQEGEGPQLPDDSIFPDVSADFSSLSWTETPQRTQRLCGVVGNAPTGQWRVRLVVATDYEAAALVQTSSRDAARILKRCSESWPESCTVQRFVNGDGNQVNSAGAVLLRMVFSDPSAQRCQEFLDALESFLLETGCGGLVEPQPAIYRAVETRYAIVPLEEVSLSVDTRPAKEWQ